MHFIFTFLLITSTTLVNGLDVEVINQWNFLTFDFPSYDWINYYRPERTFFTGVALDQERIFVSMPRIYAGVPATLAWLPRNTQPASSPILRVYPDWSWHEAGRNRSVSAICETQIISVYRMKVDSCNRLWVLDSGIMTSLEDFQRLCTPKLLVFDLNTDQLVKRVLFPREVLRPSTLLTNLVIDESARGRCDAAFIYMTDTVVPGLLVYDVARDSTWRFTHPSMFPDPDFSDATIAGESYTLMDGIVGLALAPSLGILYYQPYATNRIFSVPTSILRRGPLAELETLPVSLVGKKSSQGVGLAVDPRDNTLYFSPVMETSLASWSPVNRQQRLVAYDPEKLQFAAELLWAQHDNGNIWILSSRFQKYFRRSVTSAEINLRIMRVNTSPRSTIASVPQNNIFLSNRNLYGKK